jgi:predicted amidohydrolase
VSNGANDLRIGLCQIEVELGQRKENQRRVERWMEKFYTPSELPTALVLPELWDVGYALDSVEELADPGGMDSADFLGKLARKYNTWFIGGSVMARDDKGCYNRSQVINPQGELVAFYNKVHLVPFITKEDGVFVRGDSPCLFDFGGVPAGSVVCYDARFPEWVRLYALRGCKLLFVTSQWVRARMDMIHSLIKARAIENAMYVVLVNNCSLAGGIDFGGRSIVCSPDGEILGEASGSEDGVFVEIDTSKVDDTREFLQIFDKRLPELYTELVSE